MNTDTKPDGLVLLAALGGMFPAMLDQTIVGTALPRITTELGGSTLYTWVVTAYLLTSTVTVPLYGRLSDQHGRKPLLLIGMVVFVAGSALCGAAQDMGQLIAFRALQGLGAGALLPLSIALVMEMFPPSSGNGGRVQGALGGVLRLPNRRGTGGGRPDYAGIAVFTVAVSALLLGLTEKGLDGHAWTDAAVAGPIGFALASLVVFVLVERRAADPIMPMGLFANRTYTLVMVTSFFTAFCMYAGVVFLPRSFQEALRFSATELGLRIYPLTLAMVLGSVLMGALMSITGRYKPWLVAAPFLLAAGALLCLNLSVDSGGLALALWMLPLGLGMGPMSSGLTVAAQQSVDPGQLGTASADLTFFRQIGGSVALAVGGTLYTSEVTASAPLHGAAAAHASAAALVVPALGIAGAVIALVALVALPDRRLRPPSAPQGKVEAGFAS
ncbi:MFS transporter [Nonomuraea fuscirosea]|uniref:MFS transporter n=1 Tax=Nonomuraea fuscirosea TaxID=1291556 RepID=UPI0033D8983B